MNIEKENEALKAENANLKSQVDVLAFNYQRINNVRRFDAAKAAMQGILANPEFGSSWSKGTVIEESKWYADALLKALEEKE